jgi:hypothetical protein
MCREDFASAPEPPPVIYRIDADDIIRYVNAAWGQFALANQADALQQAVGTSLWQHISGEEVSQIYRDVFRKVRLAQSEISFPFRCDSPAIRRDMAMRVYPLDSGAIECECRVLGTTPLDSVAAMQSFPVMESTTDFLRVCSWCKRMRVAEQWLEIGPAIQTLDLMATPTPPQLTHGICPACVESMEAAI